MDIGDPSAASPEPFVELHTQQLRLIEALVEAGYRPTTFINFRREQGNHNQVEVLPSYYPPADPAVVRKWELQAGGRWVLGFDGRVEMVAVAAAEVAAGAGRQAQLDSKWRCTT